MYAVKEIFYTLQGEGANAGRAAVFCRFAGCNLWSGREEDRADGHVPLLRHRFRRHRRRGRRQVRDRRWISRGACRAAADRSPRAGLVVLTGGEPMLQVDERSDRCPACARLPDRHRDQRHARRCRRASTGSASAPRPGTHARAASGDELKLVYPQAGLAAGSRRGLDFAHRFLQPMDGPDRARNTERWPIAYCKAQPAVAAVAADPQADRHSVKRQREQASGTGCAARLLLHVADAQQSPIPPPMRIYNDFLFEAAHLPAVGATPAIRTRASTATRSARASGSTASPTPRPATCFHFDDLSAALADCQRRSRSSLAERGRGAIRADARTHLPCGSGTGSRTRCPGLARDRGARDSCHEGLHLYRPAAPRHEPRAE